MPPSAVPLTSRPKARWSEAFAGVPGTVGLRLTAPGAHRTISLVWRADRTLAPPAQRFVEFVRSWA